MMKRFLVPALLVACAAGTAKAGSVTGSLAFLDMGTTTVNSGDINTATSFTLGNLVSTQNNESGIFADAMPSQGFGAASFNLSAPTSFSISSPAFGTFTSSSLSETFNSPGIVEINILGSYTGGTIDPGSGTNPASFTVVFIQTPAHTGPIVGSGIFAVSPAQAAVPEPATWVMGLTSVVGGIFFHLRRRRRFRKATV
jgi:hypothetical protein